MSSRIIVTITSELFDDAVQEASVRSNLTVHALITETLQEFSLPEGDYSLAIEDANKPLHPQRTLEEQEVQTGASLVFQREHAQQFTRAIAVMNNSSRKMLVNVPQAALKELHTGTVFKIRWQPALIGRPDVTNPDSQKLMAVDVEPFADGLTVSRKHASLTADEEGQFYLEGLSVRNPTFVNEQELTFGEKRRLKAGDTIRVGKVMFRFDLT